MPAFLTLAAIKAFLKAHAPWLLMGLVALALLGSSLILYSRGHSAGQAEVRVEVEKQHTETIKEVRSDEHLAQNVADAVGASVANTVEQQRADTSNSLKEIKDALDARPALPAGCPADVAPAGVLASSNALVDRANRSSSPAGSAH